MRAIGEGLRGLHEALPVAGCPFDWSVPTRIANAAAGGIHVPDALRSPPPVDMLVVCHGDACAPNTLLDADGRVVFGATIDLEDLDSGKPVTYQIVGDDEADLETGKISISSPIARALIGKFEGDVATVVAPGGEREYEVLAVKYL